MSGNSPLGPYVSGLSGREPKPHPGMAMLGRIAEFVRHAIAERELLTRPRFDGVERTEPNEDAIAETEVLGAIKRMADTIASAESDSALVKRILDAFGGGAGVDGERS